MNLDNEKELLKRAYLNLRTADSIPFPDAVFDEYVRLRDSEGYKLVPVEPTYEMWSELSRDLGRYMQMHDRYCPKTLKKYFDRFIGEPPEWLTKEIKDWDSEHAFATADLPVFIYKAMIEAFDN